MRIKQVPATKEVIDFVLQGPICRDCAYQDGICPTNGFPCDPTSARKLVRSVLERINYGIANGYILKEGKRVS